VSARRLSVLAGVVLVAVLGVLLLVRPGSAPASGPSGDRCAVVAAHVTGAESGLAVRPLCASTASS
jgi:hypothetical protein